MPLEETLKRLANFISFTEKLADIKELARKNLVQLSWGLRSTFQVPFEIFLTGSTAERFDSPLSSIWMKCSDVDCSHTLVSDYDYMTLREKFLNTEFFSGLYFPIFVRTVYGDFRSKSPYSVQIQENTDQ